MSDILPFSALKVLIQFEEGLGPLNDDTQPRNLWDSILTAVAHPDERSSSGLSTAFRMNRLKRRVVREEAVKEAC